MEGRHTTKINNYFRALNLEIMKQLTQKQLENQVIKFNESYKVGDKVEVLKLKNGTDTFIDTIKHEATILGGHTAMTWLKNKGCYDLTFVKGLANDLPV